MTGKTASNIITWLPLIVKVLVFHENAHNYFKTDRAGTVPRHIKLSKQTKFNTIGSSFLR
jgi:hypothetical protein